MARYPHEERSPCARSASTSFPLFSGAPSGDSSAGSDGAAALYGGDAVGGAINIVLRRDFKGFEAQAGAARPRLDGADSEQGSFVWGGAFGRGRAVVGLDVVRREEMDPYSYPRDRYHASVRVSRGRVAAIVSIRSWGDGGLFQRLRTCFQLLRSGRSQTSFWTCHGDCTCRSVRVPVSIPGC